MVFLLVVEVVVRVRVVVLTGKILLDSGKLCLWREWGETQSLEIPKENKVRP